MANREGVRLDLDGILRQLEANGFDGVRVEFAPDDGGAAAVLDVVRQGMWAANEAANEAAPDSIWASAPKPQRKPELNSQRFKKGDSMARKGDIMNAGPSPGQWGEASRLNALEIANMLGVSLEAYNSDPIALVPALQNYVSRLPLDQFETSDWVTLHSDLTACLADILTRRHDVTWQAVGTPGGPGGIRYVVEAQGLDGNIYRMDPADVVHKEFSQLPIEIIRMLAGAELTLRLTRRVPEG
ncbi:hypothetical protein [Streptomyces sp. SPB162]|uniref:hypothetical protein n=1 Tax=Streptomyces sp. SPB162 TaxID=2940560 RepID=UPI002405D29E|nr:hypothetical protein [Streptomyces sp. SPB162]MDF9814786.1 hypothetical protein [Streptomyces sp. SPB162]